MLQKIHAIEPSCICITHICIKSYNMQKKTANSSANSDYTTVKDEAEDGKGEENDWHEFKRKGKQREARQMQPQTCFHQALISNPSSKFRRKAIAVTTPLKIDQGLRSWLDAFRSKTQIEEDVFIFPESDEERMFRDGGRWLQTS